jgi:hypothetical protein
MPVAVNLKVLAGAELKAYLPSASVDTVALSLPAKILTVMPAG